MRNGTLKETLHFHYGMSGGGHPRGQDFKAGELTRLWRCGNGLGSLENT